MSLFVEEAPGGGSPRSPRFNLLLLPLAVFQVKKETQVLREFEEGLVSQYKFYLEDLEQTVKGTPPSP